jgi:hypothetical protein
MSDDLFEFLAAREAGRAAREAGRATGEAQRFPPKCVNHRQESKGSAALADSGNPGMPERMRICTDWELVDYTAHLGADFVLGKVPFCNSAHVTRHNALLFGATGEAAYGGEDWLHVCK